MFALDTNTLIYFFKGMGNVAERLFAHPPAEIAIPAIVLYELEVGLAKSESPKKRRAQLERMMSVTSVLPFDKKTAVCAATIRVALERAGTPIGQYDLLIAATAVSAGATLVTRNTAEFERVHGLRLENWY